MEVPHGLGDEATRAWVSDCRDQLRELWSEEWREGFGSGVEDILTAAIATRADDVVLDVLCWPFRGPAIARVTVSVGPVASVGARGDAGFEVDAYEGASIGPGVQCIDTTEVVGEQETVRFIAAHYLFSDGDRTVQVTVEPTFFEVFARMLPGLHGFIDSLEVRDSDGVPFVAQPMAGRDHIDADEWQVQTGE